jgi:short-subunit dehydrogenase
LARAGPVQHNSPMSHATLQAGHEPHADPHAAPEPPPAPTKRARERTAIVVGASSGIGAEIVKQLAREGVAVAAVARRRALLDELAKDASGSAGRVIPIEHDAARFEEAPALFETIVRELGGLDLFVYAAGIMPEVGPQEYDTRKDLEMLAVNLGGCVAWTNEVAKLFRTQRSGTIVGISSIAGERGRKGNPMYGTTKAAMNHYLEALRNRLADYGVHVCTIKPGFVETAMIAAARAQGRKIRGAIPADAAARSILRAARSRRNEVFVPAKWRVVAFVIRNIPSVLFKGMNI